MTQSSSIEVQVAQLSRTVANQRRLLVGLVLLLAVAALVGAAGETPFEGNVTVKKLLKCLTFQTDGKATFMDDVAVKKNITIDGDAEIKGELSAKSLGKAIPQYDYLGRVGIRAGPVPTVHQDRREATPGEGKSYLLKRYSGRRVIAAWHSLSDGVNGVPGTFTHIMTEVRQGSESKEKDEVWLSLISVDNPKMTIGNVQVHVLYCEN